ncbi:MAG: MFS transporter [Mycetocola sp.]
MTSSPHTGTPDQSDRVARLDALPFTKEHRRVFVGSGLGWALDAMDVGLISFVLAQLAVSWNASPQQLSWIASAGFVGMALGASLGGLLADRIGRRQVFAVTLLVFGLATGASALAWSVGALIALRFVVGLGLGAELPVASTLMSEFSPPRIRGRVIVLLEAFWAVGWLAAAVIGYFVVPVGDNGWRWAFLIGAVPAAYAVIVRWGLPESVRFLESKGRHRDAEAVVERFEASAASSRRGDVASTRVSVHPVSMAAPVPADAPGVTPTAAPARARVASLFAPARRVQTIALWLVWFCVNFSYYGAFIWLPTILVAAGFDLVKSFEYTLIITLAQLPGYAASAFLVEKLGRGRTLALFLVGSAVSAVFFGQASDVSQILIAGMALSFFNLGAWGALYAVTPELYPTRLRGTGAGWAAGVGRIASIVAPLLVPLLREQGGTPLLFVVFAVVFAVAALAALFLRDQRGMVLED